MCGVSVTRVTNLVLLAAMAVGVFSALRRGIEGLFELIEKAACVWLIHDSSLRELSAESIVGGLMTL